MADDTNSKPNSVEQKQERTPLPTCRPRNQPMTEEQEHNAMHIAALTMAVIGDQRPLGTQQSEDSATASWASGSDTKEADGPGTATQGSSSQEASAKKKSPARPDPIERCSCEKCTAECGPDGKMVKSKLKHEHERGWKIQRDGTALPWEQSCDRCKKMKNPKHECKVLDRYKSCGHCVLMKEGCSLNPKTQKRKRSPEAQVEAETENNPVPADEEEPPAKGRKTSHTTSTRTCAPASEPGSKPLEADVRPALNPSRASPTAETESKPVLDGEENSPAECRETSRSASEERTGDRASEPDNEPLEGDVRPALNVSRDSPETKPEGFGGGVVYEALVEPLSGLAEAGDLAATSANPARPEEADFALQTLANIAALQSYLPVPARHSSGWTPINVPRNAPANTC